MSARSATLAFVLAGCQPPLVEINHATDERVWFISKDAKRVYRCFDMTPQVRPFTSDATWVYCLEAPIYPEGSRPPRLDVNK